MASICLGLNVLRLSMIYIFIKEIKIMKILQLKGYVIMQIVQDILQGVFIDMIPECTAITFFWKWVMIFFIVT